jgi:MoxR-like ATPase
MDGRPAVSEEDVQKAAFPVMRHRISTNFQAQAEGKTSDDIVRQLLAAVGPREEGKYDKRRR